MKCAGWALHKSLWLRRKAGMETQLALHPPSQEHWLRAVTTQRSAAFSNWHKDSAEGNLAFCDACYVELRLSPFILLHVLLLFPGISIVKCH